MSHDVRRAIDDRLDRVVLVTGRRVPASADLELVVPAAAGDAVTAALSGAGFEQRGHTWARFHSCDATVVTVHDLAAWRVPDDEVDRMTRDAVPVEGCRWLHWLSTSDELLVLARRLATETVEATPERRERLHRALVAEPASWVDAAERAERCGAAAAVRIARDAFDGARPIGNRERRELARESGQQPPLAATGVIALSGLDGSGKSTQAHALGATLPKLGFDVSVEWTRLSFDASLDVIAAPVKAALALRRGRSEDARDTAVDADPAGGLRERSPVVHKTWTGVVATANGLNQRRTTRAQLQASRVVVRDRYVLDSVVQLHSVYGSRHDVSRQARVVESLSPRPLAAFYLVVPPDIARARKPEEYTVDELAAHAALYRREAERLGVSMVDATRPRDEIAAELARTVWSLLT